MLPVLKVVCSKRNSGDLKGFNVIAQQGDNVVLETNKDVDDAYDQVEAALFPLAGELYIEGAPARLATKVAFVGDGRKHAEVTMPVTEHGSCAADYDDGEDFVDQMAHLVATLNPGDYIADRFSGLLR